ncbi:hypothetical protein [Streptomyces sp. NPDC127098]|uniref:hypothetical protein n=1 Tax=Streptomyces sp. NPDC127098 TaxID=3347137 RepID=UPI00365FB9CC
MRGRIGRWGAVAVAAGAVSLGALTGTAQAAEVTPLPPGEVVDWDGECVGGDEVPVHVGWEVRDAPEALVPGEWTEFSLRVTNTGTDPLPNLLVYADLWPTEDREPDERWTYSLQWLGPTGWRDIQFESDAYGGNFAAVADLQPGDWIEPQVRVRLGEEASGAMHGFLSARHVSPEGACSRAAESSELFFDIAATEPEPEPTPTEPAPTEPEPTPTEPEPTPSEPEPTRPSATPDDRPQLAETGSGGALPAVGAVGALAVAAGGGVLLVRRRGRA